MKRKRYVYILFDLKNNEHIATDNVSKDYRDIYIHTDNYYDYEIGKTVSKKVKTTKTIDANYIKIVFSSHFSDVNDYFGLRAIVIPNYENQE